MNFDEHFSETTIEALQNDPPGSWIPNVPKVCIRLNAGYPAPELVPTLGIVSAMHKVVDQEGDKPFQYTGSRTAADLGSWLERRMRERGVAMAHDGLIVTAGAIQGIDLIARVLLDNQSVVAVEEPTYMEALEVFHNYTDHILSIPVDEDGMQVSVLAERLADLTVRGLETPKLVYTIPTFQNPTGTTLSPARREALLELANFYDFLILEDDAYGELHFDGAPPTLKSMDADGRVVYVGSMSKVIAPGVRIGWLVAHPDLVRAVDWFKKDLSHPMMEAAISNYLHGVSWEERLQVLQKAYHERRNVMLKALRKYMPKRVSWTVPQGGYFIWLRVPGIDTEQLLYSAMKRGVSFIPGRYFFAEQRLGTEWLRLSYSYENISNLIRGVQCLSDMLRTD